MDNSEKALVGRLSLLEEINSELPIGVIVTNTDPDFTVLEANDGYFAMLGYTRESFWERVGNKGFDTLHIDDRDEALKEFFTQTQVYKNKNFAIKCRVMCADDSFKWVMFNGVTTGNKLYFIIIDAGEQKKTLDLLEKEQEFSSRIIDLSDDSFFDYDVESKNMRFSNNLTSRFPMNEIMDHFPEEILRGEAEGEKSGGNCDFDQNMFETELEFTSENGEQAWYGCRYRKIKNERGNLARIVGKMTDITKQRLAIEELTEKAERDQLTGLYNKMTTEYLIKQSLKMRRASDKLYALMIIDIDNFKRINDTFGHLYGDAVLAEFADMIKPNLRSEDVVGRVGGDEMFVFIKNYSSIDFLCKKAERICRLFHKQYAMNDHCIDISASIGISLCPDHATDFESLYRYADSALYNAKAKGKNRFEIYSHTENLSYQSTRTEIDENGTIQKNFRDNAVEYVFRLLFQAKDVVGGVQAVLQLVTEHLKYSRGYIFEIDRERTFTYNTFEWCAPGVSPEIHNLQKVPIALVSTAMKSFEKNGMFVIHDVTTMPQHEQDLLTAQGIKAMAQFALISNERIVGFIGFDDCEHKRTPDSKEIGAMKTICDVLGHFLIKERMAEAERNTTGMFSAVVNTFSAVAVVDANTRKIVFENEKMVAYMGKENLGRFCYEVYAGKGVPCETCGAQTVLNDQVHGESSSGVCACNLGYRYHDVLWDKNEKVKVVTITDIEKHKQ